MPSITIDVDAATSSSPEGLVNQVIQATEDHQPAESPSSPEDVIVPVVLFLAIAVTYCIKYYFAHRTRQETQQTVRIALERGEPLTPELLDRLGQPSVPKHNDLRRGVIGVGLGLGIAAFGLVVGQPDATRPMVAIGLVPLLVGLAYLVLWRLGGGKA